MIEYLNSYPLNFIRPFFDTPHWSFETDFFSDPEPSPDQADYDDPE